MFANPVRSGLLFIGLAMIVLAPGAWAQEGEDVHGKNDCNYNPTTAELILPTNNDYAEMPADDEKAGKTSGFGTDAAFGFASNIQAGSITPTYRFSRALAVKLRVPYIFQHTVYYQDWSDDEIEATASGLGDISFDFDYKPQMKTPGTKVLLSATVKLPTGDQDKVYTDENDQEWGVPLGSGSVDFAGRASFAKSTSKSGWITALMFRLNTGGESSTPWGSSTRTDEITAGNQFAISGFGRLRVGKGIWAHLGASFLLAGDGKSVVTITDANGEVISETESDVERAGTLLDLFPGVSYTMGPLNPYLGVRIPIVSSYDNDNIEPERQASVVLQFSYNPLRMAGM